MKPPMLAPDETTRRAVEKAAQAYCFGPDGADCDMCVAAVHCAHWRDQMPAMTVAIAAFLDAMGQDIAAARVRRCLNADEGGV
jgi:hypothetical protein